MSKGSKRRPAQVSDAEVTFRWDYAQGTFPHMTREQFDERINEIRRKAKMKRC